MNQLVLDLQSADPSYRLIPLTRGQVAIVDAADFEWISQWKWFAHFAPNTKSFYAKRMDKTRDGKQPTIHMHRIIASAPDGMVVDHRNHNTLDNRRLNLRVASYSENGKNRSIRFDNKSGCPGVTLYHGRLWRARIGVDGRRIFLGDFETLEEAAGAYKSAAAKFHGEFSTPLRVSR